MSSHPLADHHLLIDALMHELQCDFAAASAWLDQWEKRPDGPCHRHEKLMQDLSQRFPEVHKKWLGHPPAEEYVGAVDHLQSQLAAMQSPELSTDVHALQSAILSALKVLDEHPVLARDSAMGQVKKLLAQALLQSR